VTSEGMKFYAIASKLAKPFSNKGKTLVVQFTAKYEKNEYSFCGGGYIKLLPEGTDLASFDGNSEYSIMFGPDRCGHEVSRIHAIFGHNGKNLLKKDDIKLEYNDKNEFTHLYTLIVHPDNTYEVLMDEVSKSKGTLHEHWAFEQKEIDDPTDKKPKDWVDDAKIPDPEDKKPEGYDDIPRQIPDPAATKPDDWNEEEDGEWEPPMIDNPDYKGPWRPKMIDNPDYKGPWVHPKIPNPDYKPDDKLYAVCSEGCTHVGFELWQVKSGTIFDDIIITDSLEEAQKFAEETFFKKKSGESKMYDDIQEQERKQREKEMEEAEKESKAKALDDDEDLDDLLHDEL